MVWVCELRMRLLWVYVYISQLCAWVIMFSLLCSWTLFLVRMYVPAWPSVYRCVYKLQWVFVLGVLLVVESLFRVLLRVGLSPSWLCISEFGGCVASVRGWYGFSAVRQGGCSARWVCVSRSVWGSPSSVVAWYSFNGFWFGSSCILPIRVDDNWGWILILGSILLLLLLQHCLVLPFLCLSRFGVHSEVLDVHGWETLFVDCGVL